MGSDLRLTYFSEDQFSESLRGLLSSNDETKQAAEKIFRAMEIQFTDDFGISLIRCAVKRGEDPIIELREIAASTLMQYVKTHWCSASEGFQSPEITMDSKISMKELLPAGLCSSSSEVRTAVVNSIITIARFDGLENWPGLLNELVTWLNDHSSTSSILGVLQLYTEFTRKLTDTWLPHICPIVSQDVYKIYESEDQYSDDLGCSAIGIFGDMIASVSAFKQPGLIPQYLEPSISKFCAEFVRDGFESGTELECEIVKALEKLIKTLPKCVSNFLPKLLPSLWETLIHCAEVYQKSTVTVGENVVMEDTHSNGEEPEGEGIANEEGDSDEEEPESVDNFVIAAFEFIQTLMSGSNTNTSDLPEYNLSDYHWFHLQDSLPPELLRHLINFLEITDKQIEVWTANPSQFVIDERLIDITSDSHSIRTKAQELLIKILHRSNRVATNALCDMILEKIEASNAMRTNNSDMNENWWKLHEASIQAFGFTKDFAASRQQAETLSFDFAAFLENVVLENLNNSESHPLLVGRCLYIGGLYAELMPLELRSRFLESTIYCLKNKPACTKILAAKAANYWLSAVFINGNSGDNGNALRPHLPALFQELFNLGNQFMSVEVLTIVLENFATLASLDKAFTASVQSKISSLAITAFVNFRSNCLVLGICQKIFKELTLNPECLEPLQTYLIPTLVGNLTVSRSEDPVDVEAYVDVLEVLMLLVEHSPQPLSSFLIESAFPAICRFILSSDKYCTLLKGGLVIRIYLSVAADQVINYKDSQGNTGPQCILQVATHLLNFKPGNLLVKDACEIVTLLIKKTGRSLSEDVNSLLTAMFGSMQCVEARDRLQKLLLVFAHLLNNKFEDVFTFLSSAQGPNEQCGLAFVISKGFCEKHELFERDDRRTVTSALSKILEHSVTHQDSKMHQINFQAAGDSEPAIPLLVKISKLISNELSSDAYKSS